MSLSGIHFNYINQCSLQWIPDYYLGDDKTTKTKLTEY